MKHKYNWFILLFKLQLITKTDKIKLKLVAFKFSFTSMDFVIVNYVRVSRKTWKRFLWTRKFFPQIEKTSFYFTNLFKFFKLITKCVKINNVMYPNSSYYFKIPNLLTVNGLWTITATLPMAIAQVEFFYAVLFITTTTNTVIFTTHTFFTKKNCLHFSRCQFVGHFSALDLRGNWAL